MFKKLKEFFKNQKGFSLMELIVVIAILGVIASIAVPNVLNAIENARRNTDRTNASQIARAITTAIAEGKTITASSYTDFDDSAFDEIVPEYIQSVPDLQLVPSASSDDSFYVMITTDNVVTIYAKTAVGASGAADTYTQIFPTPAGDWAN